MLLKWDRIQASNEFTKVEVEINILFFEQYSIYEMYGSTVLFELQLSRVLSLPTIENSIEYIILNEA